MTLAMNRAATPISLLEQAKALRPLFERMGEANEKKGLLSDEVVHALHSSGLFAMWVPNCLGGAELTPTESLKLIEEVACADGSTGWVLMAAALSTGAAAAYLGDESVKGMFSGNRSPVMAGQGAPVGRAKETDGGYELSGNWNYGSGIRHADYVHTGALVLDRSGSIRMGQNCIPEARIFIVPREKFAFGENWDVIGLRATGSIDYSASGVIVPEHATHLTECTTPKRGGPFYMLGIKGMGSIGHTGFALGVGRRMLDEIAQLARTKSGRLGLLGDSESFLEKFGAAEAKFRAARALAFDTWDAIEETLYRGQPLTTRQHTLHRLALNHATWTAAEVCMFAYQAGGGVSLRASVIQRCFRDMNAGTQHITSAPPVLRDCGRELAGLAKDKVWGFTTLIDVK